MQLKLHPIFYIKMDNQDTTNLTNPVPTGDAVEFNIFLIPMSDNFNTFHFESTVVTIRH